MKEFKSRKDMMSRKDMLFGNKNSNTKKNYSQIQNTSKNNLRINRSGRGN